MISSLLHGIIQAGITASQRQISKLYPLVILQGETQSWMHITVNDQTSDQIVYKYFLSEWLL